MCTAHPERFRCGMQAASRMLNGSGFAAAPILLSPCNSPGNGQIAFFM